MTTAKRVAGSNQSSLGTLCTLCNTTTEWVTAVTSKERVVGNSHRPQLVLILGERVAILGKEQGIILLIFIPTRGEVKRAEVGVSSDIIRIEPRKTTPAKVRAKEQLDAEQVTGRRQINTPANTQVAKYKPAKRLKEPTATTRCHRIWHF